MGHPSDFLSVTVNQHLKRILPRGLVVTLMGIQYAILMEYKSVAVGESDGEVEIIELGRGSMNPTTVLW
jgi:hypothetical protein